MNIYGDMKTCIKCDMKADVVESGKDYCAECWFKHFQGVSIKEYEDKQEKENNIERTKSNQKKV